MSIGRTLSYSDLKTDAFRLCALYDCENKNGNINICFTFVFLDVVDVATYTEPSKYK